MGQRTFEGTWGEIIHHRSELIGRRIRVTILDEPVSQQPTFAEAAARLIRDAENLASSLPSEKASPISDSDVWTESVAEKYRRQEFKL